MIESGEQVPNDILTHILRIICEQYYIANHVSEDTVIHDVATNAITCNLHM